jgi:hypothetical protein
MNIDTTTEEWTEAGVIGVDAGLCWIGDPCYIAAKDCSHAFDSWSQFCGMLSSRGYPTVQQFDYHKGHPGLGVCLSSGYGDGEYKVYVKRNSEGRIAAACVVFIEEVDDEL